MISKNLLALAREARITDCGPEDTCRITIYSDAGNGAQFASTGRTYTQIAIQHDETGCAGYQPTPVMSALALAITLHDPFQWQTRCDCYDCPDPLSPRIR